jgi:hypothetical protein
MTSKNPAPTATNPVEDRRVQPARAAAGEVEVRPTTSRALDALQRGSARDLTTGCLLWQGAVRANGYGHVRLDGRTHKTHRLAYEAWCGPIPAEASVCHRCDTRRCIEPTHLFLGSIADNNRDRNAKGRQAKGETQGHAKLTEADVRAIRASSASNQALAAQYGVFHTAIWKARTGRSWSHIEMEVQS